MTILGPDRCRPARRGNFGDLSERHRTAGRHRDQDIVGDGLRIFPQVARVAHVDTEALPALDRCRHGLAAERGGNDVLNVLNHDAVARQCSAVGRHIEIVAADAALRVGG